MRYNLRSQIPSLRNKNYFNYGGQGPLPKPSLDEIIKSWETLQDIGPFTNDVWPFIYKEIISTKNSLSQLLGVRDKNIALSENITTGMILPLWGIRCNKGDELLISDCEHPGIVFACREFCRRNNLIFKILPLQKVDKNNDQIIIDQISKHINKKTKILVISHILWNYGYEIPIKIVKGILNEFTNDSYLLVDGAQSFGHIEIKDEVRYSDLYAITSHKWACGPEGLGAIYLSDKFIQNSNPTIIGWKSLKIEQGIYEPHENLLHTDARKFEIATTCVPLLAGLRKSLELFNKDLRGKEKKRLIKSKSNKLWNELNKLQNIKLSLEPPLSNGIVSFDIEKLSDKSYIIDSLGKKDIWIRLVEDPKLFRICIHQITTEDEINLLVNEIDLLMRSPRYF